jgi:hypothetical protein
MAAQTYTWKTPAGGNWTTAGDWSVDAGTNASPGANQAGDVALIAPIANNSTSYTVTLNATPTNSIGTLTISDGLGTLALSAASKALTVTGTTMLSAGTINISNAATLSTKLFAINGGSFIEGAGSLSVSSTGGFALNVSAGSFSMTGGTATVAGTSRFTNASDSIANATFSSGALVLGSAFNTSTLTLSAATVSTAGGGGVTVNSGSTLIGSGQVTGVISGTGTVEAKNGTLDLVSDIGNSNSAKFDIFNGASSVLEVDGSVGIGHTFTFLGNSGELLYANKAALVTTLSGLNVGTTLTPTNFIDYKGRAVTVTSGGNHTGTGAATVTLSDGSVLTLSGTTGSNSGTWHVSTVASGSDTEIFLSTVCFAAGARILTATGERPVETLARGDIVLTVAGDRLSAQPVRWVGRRRIDLQAHRRPETVAPVRIQRDAFAENMPHAELVVSPDHAIFVDGKLICARQLINGTTIRQDMQCLAIDYYHIELDQHAILLAEGLPAESYLDTGNRGFFANSDAPLVLHPDLTDESDCPSREAGSCAPFVWDEATVRPVWQRLADRAAALGKLVPQHATTDDSALRLVAKGRTVKPVHVDERLAIFALPRHAAEVRLVSRAASPTDTRPWMEDRRRLGVRVARIVLRTCDDMHEVPVDHPALTKGWWAVERDGNALRRWTDGDAVLPLPAMDGDALLEIHFGGAITYLAQTETDARRSAA